MTCDTWGAYKHQYVCVCVCVYLIQFAIQKLTQLAKELNSNKK